MFHVVRKNLFFLPSRRSFSSSSTSTSQVRRLLIRFPVRDFSYSSSSPKQSHWNWCRNVPVIVWWDADNCPVPSGVNPLSVAPSIMAAVRANGIKGKIQIIGFSDFKSPKVDFNALMLTDITFHSVGGYPGEKNDAYKELVRDLHFWVSNNPPPAHLFLILGDKDDRDLSGILHQLRMKNYNILIACSGRASDTLCTATTIMWQWSSMLKREDVIGKHFNYPPDAPFNSIYGGLKMPLGNPFSATPEPTSSENAKIQEPFLDIKVSETSFALKNKQRDGRKEVDQVCHNPYSSPGDNSLIEKKRGDGSAETYSKSSTFFSWINNWWTFWKSSSESSDFLHVKMLFI